MLDIDADLVLVCQRDERPGSAVREVKAKAARVIFSRLCEVRLLVGTRAEHYFERIIWCAWSVREDVPQRGARG
jgi:hypothetical protein